MMEEIYNKPCNGALSALPGDLIEYYNDGGLICSAVVGSCFWDKASNNQKIWSYRTVFNLVVPNHKVVKVIKSETNTKLKVENKEHIQELRSSISAEELFYKTLDGLQISSTIKTAIICAVKDDARNLEVAAFLLQTRADGFKEASLFNQTDRTAKV